MDESHTSQIGNALNTLGINDLTVPPSLKSMMITIKTTVTTPLTHDNYPTWRSQVLKLFRANEYDGFLDGSTSCPPKSLLQADRSSSPSPVYRLWKQIDQNLASALCSTINPSLLPYVINLDTAYDIWTTIERQLQSTNRSKVIQLKNALHNIQKKNKTMQQYLVEIKGIVDSIAAAGANVDNEDIILYTLCGLPSSYQLFKTSIRTTLTPISLDVFYALLCNEEINTAVENDIQPEIPTALPAQRTRGRGSPFRGRGHWSPALSSHHIPNSQRNAAPQCQICQKFRHTTLQCWHRHNANYAPSTASSTPTAFAASPQPVASWLLDSSLNQYSRQCLSTPAIHGNEHITVGNGSQVPIQHIGQGILPTSLGKLHLSQLLHTPHLSHTCFLSLNLLQIILVTSYLTHPVFL